MPPRPMRPCATPGCITLVKSGVCPEHRQAREQQRGTAHERGYNDPHYHAWRQQVMQKNHGLCVACSAIGITTVARVADHILPRSAGGAQYDTDNGQPLCDGLTGRGCHDRKRAAESRGQQMVVRQGLGLVEVGPLPRREVA